MVQFYESWFQILWVNVEKKGSISMSQCWKEGVQFSMSHVEKRVQYCESCWTAWKIQLFESCWNRRVSILRVICWKGFSSLSNILKRVFNSVSQIKKDGFQFSESYFFTIRFQFLESYFKVFQCLEFFVEKKKLWITFKKKV